MSSSKSPLQSPGGSDKPKEISEKQGRDFTKTCVQVSQLRPVKQEIVVEHFTCSDVPIRDPRSQKVLKEVRADAEGCETRLKNVEVQVCFFWDISVIYNDGRKLSFV